MSRKNRQLSNSGIYHILIQGYNKTAIFEDESDRKFFINILLDNILQNNIKILAYCILDNHAHLLIGDLQNILSKLVKEITKKYAYYLNTKYKRTGKVFHDRFRSEPIEDTESLISILDFIHNNPLKHNLTKLPNHYQWSNYNCYLYNDHTENSLNELLNRLFQGNDDFLKLSLNHTNNISNHKFMDCNNIDTHKTILSETQAKIFIKDYLENKNETLESVKTNWELRYSLIHELKENSNLSIRKIAYLLSLTRGIVQNIK
jgi:REP element-mobilizing transposase RayT/DNA-binding transcriptional regulator YiaG